MNTVIRRRSTWHHPKAQNYQVRMKRRPTRAERRFDDLLDEALKDTPIQFHKATQSKRSKWHRKKRKFKKQCVFTDTINHKAYIVDFYIPALKLVFEIDGVNHNKTQDYDAIRTSYLAKRGIKVIRYTNQETLAVEHCLERLRKEIKDRIANPKHKPVFIPECERPAQNIDLDTLTEQYLQQGGNITKLPTVGHKRKIISK